MLRNSSTCSTRPAFPSYRQTIGWGEVWCIEASSPRNLEEQRHACERALYWKKESQTTWRLQFENELQTPCGLTSLPFSPTRYQTELRWISSEKDRHLWRECVVNTSSTYRRVLSANRARRQLWHDVVGWIRDLLSDHGTVAVLASRRDTRTLLSATFQIPLRPYPKASTLQVPLEQLTIPAGKSTEGSLVSQLSPLLAGSFTTQKFRWTAGNRLEFYMQHDQEFTLFFFHAEDDTVCSDFFERHGAVPMPWRTVGGFPWATQGHTRRGIS